MTNDNFLNHNFDKILLFISLVMAGFMVLHMVHRNTNDLQSIAWSQSVFSTILGALVLMLTGRIQRAADTSQPNSSTVTVSSTATPPTPPGPLPVPVVAVPEVGAPEGKA